MKRIAAILLLLASLLLAACGDTATQATPTNVSAPTSTIASQPTDTAVIEAPTDTAEPAPTDTLVPQPTDTVPPTATDVPPTATEPAPTTVPAVATDTAISPTAASVATKYEATASVDNAAPAPSTTVRVTGKLLADGKPVAGATMNSSWHYASKDTPCDGAKTKADGTAGCSNAIGRPTKGFTVKIDVTFVDDAGKVLATAKTSFTPQ